MKVLKPCLLVVFLLLIGGFLFRVRANHSGQIQVLFIGNSWTGNAAEHLNSMTAQVGGINAASVIHGGYSLKNQWNDTNQKVQYTAELAKGVYDFAVIHDFAGNAAGNPDETLQYGILFDNLFKSYNVQTVIFMPWMYTPTGQGLVNIINNTYWVANQLDNAPVAPVGVAFDRSYSQRPDLVLTKPDGHTFPLGAYLRDLVFYVTLTGQSPDGLAGEYGLSESDEQFLKGIAWETVNEYLTNRPQPTGPAYGGGEGGLVGDIDLNGAVDIRDFNQVIDGFGSDYNLLKFNAVVSDFGKVAGGV